MDFCYGLIAEMSTKRKRPTVLNRRALELRQVCCVILGARSPLAGNGVYDLTAAFLLTLPALFALLSNLLLLLPILGHSLSTANLLGSSAYLGHIVSSLLNPPCLRAFRMGRGARVSDMAQTHAYPSPAI